MAKKDQIGGAFSDLVGGSHPQKGKGKTEPKKRSLGVYLENEQIERLDQIANEVGKLRSHVMAFAIEEFIRRYDSGEYKAVTETITETVTTLKPAK